MTATKQASSRQERAAERDLAEVAELLSGTPPEPRPADPAPGPALPHDKLADELLATPTPAVGILNATPNQLPSVIAAFTRTGIFAGREQYSATATAMHVSREARGRFVVERIQPGRSSNWLRPETFTPSFGAGATAETLAYLTNLAAGLRSAPAARDVPMLIILDQDAFDLDEPVRAGLERLAIAADAVVAVVQDSAESGWTSKTLERAAAPPEPVVAQQPEPTPAAELTGLLPASWFEGIGRQVRGYPESLTTPAGDRVQVAYGQRDENGRRYLALRGHRVDEAGRLVPLQVAVAPGCTVALDAVRVYA